LTKENVNALCIVAHPDDETIWMGGTILQNNQWKWTVLSLCRKDDSDRAPKFKKVCEIYRAKGIISDLDDESLNPMPVEKIAEKIKLNLPNKEYNYIFTHGENGEYGHIRHKETHKAVEWMTKNNLLKCKKLFYFDYIDGDKEASNNRGVKIPVADSEADWIVSLNSKTLKQKKNIVEAIHGFPKKGFEVMACGKKEGFVLAK